MNCAKDNVISRCFTWSRWKEDGKMSCHTWKQPGLSMTHISACIVDYHFVLCGSDVSLPHWTFILEFYHVFNSQRIFRLIGYNFTSADNKGMVEKALMSTGASRWFCNVLGLQCKRYWLFNNFVKEKSKLKILGKFGWALGILECDFINFRPKVVGDIEFE
jgi:hypothetical protein